MLLDVDVVLVRLYGGRLGAGDEEEPAFPAEPQFADTTADDLIEDCIEEGMNHRLHIARSIQRKCQQTHFRI